MPRETFEKLDLKPFEMRPGRPLPIRGQLENRDPPPAKQVCIVPIRWQNTDQPQHIEADAWELLRKFAASQGIGFALASTLTPQDAVSFANAIAPLLNAALAVTDVAKKQRGLEIRKKFQ